RAKRPFRVTPIFMRSHPEGENVATSGWTRASVIALVLACLAVLCDGLDTQLLGLVIPVLARQWHVPAAAFVPLLALNIVFMSIGTAVMGLLGDRIGRRPILITCMLLFG